VSKSDSRSETSRWEESMIRSPLLEFFPCFRKSPITIFESRESEIFETYLGREDLAHVPPEDILMRKLRPSEEQELAREVSARSNANAVQPDHQTQVAHAVSAVSAQSQEYSSEADSDYDRAKQMGYTGDSCPECGSMTMIRNGTCLKCITCGSTTGCS